MGVVPHRQRSTLLQTLPIVNKLAGQDDLICVIIGYIEFIFRWQQKEEGRASLESGPDDRRLQFMWRQKASRFYRTYVRRIYECDLTFSSKSVLFLFSEMKDITAKQTYSKPVRHRQTCSRCNIFSGKLHLTSDRPAPGQARVLQIYLT